MRFRCGLMLEQSSLSRETLLILLFIVQIPVGISAPILVEHFVLASPLSSLVSSDCAVAFASSDELQRSSAGLVYCSVSSVLVSVIMASSPALRPDL